MSTGSSTVEDTEVVVDAGVSNDVVVEQPDKGALETGTPADSPSAEDSGAKGPATALEAVKAAIEVKPAADSPPQGDSLPKPGEVAKPAATAESDKALPFHNHPRWKEVTTAKAAAEAAVVEMTPKAQRWDAIDEQFRATGLAADDVQPLFEGGAHLKRAGVTREEVGNLMKVGAALKIGDRQVVQSLAGPIFEALGLQLVEKLPPEIQAMIDEGAINEDAGKRMAGLQFQSKAEATRREMAEGRETVRSTHEAAALREAEFTRASGVWEARVKAGDADWSRKEPFIIEAIQARVALREPTTAKEVEQICQDSYDQVSRVMRGSGVLRPTVRPTGGGSSTTVKVAPKTALDAVKAGLGAS
jgi:hypothetical protein